MKIILSNQIEVQTTPNIEQKIIEQFTFANPKYQDAINFGRSTHDIQRTICLVESSDNGLAAPMGILDYLLQTFSPEIIDQRAAVPAIEGSPFFDDYIEGVLWAQEYARINRQIMLENVIAAMLKVRGLPKFKANLMVVNCHHNYISEETHFDKACYVTRKGAVSAQLGELGIIPGSRGQRVILCAARETQSLFVPVVMVRGGICRAHKPGNNLHWMIILKRLKVSSAEKIWMLSMKHLWLIKILMQ